MAKNECEIIKDLLPNYIEETTSKVTNEYIETHIGQCNSCKESLKLLQKEKNKEERKQEKEEKKEINYLKRYNIKVRVLQGVALLLAGIILGSWTFLGNMLITRWQKEKKLEEDEKLSFEAGRENYEIITKAYEELEKIKQGQNYILISEYHNENKEFLGNIDYKITYYYKNGKYKRVEENFAESGTITSLGFGTSKDGKDNAIEFCEIQINGENRKIVTMSAYRREEMYFLDNLYKAGQAKASKCENRIENQDGKEYIVIKADTSEIWINRENNIVEKAIDLEGTRYQTTYNYTMIPNVVTDDDLKLPSTEGYEIDGFTKYLIEEHIDI